MFVLILIPCFDSRIFFLSSALLIDRGFVWKVMKKIAHFLSYQLKVILEKADTVIIF